MNNHVLERLLNNAEQAKREALQMVAENQRNTSHIEQQLQRLQQYRSEYATQLQLQLGRGMSTTLVSTYRQFLHGLDNAIGQAQGLLTQQQQKTDVSQQHWQQQQQRWQAFSTLQQRQRDTQQQLQQRREQRQTDELAQQFHAHRSKLID
ncbi:flagellar export protein FliJ [Pseudidiomarina insulisalsae]|uniref:Flagellar FliJ protein n=1 Tax=Pseudidiomarina insulisalsae TaxID=575789 RepID=A0A432YDR2_9GAMM|nr:flagellar export protein FliJ [Pseudidiomarina insulisalsae]RUO59053.1 flagellar export protein FliJ [Pseudidiomarina insulisalsae]